MVYDHRPPNASTSRRERASASRELAITLSSSSSVLPPRSSRHRARRRPRRRASTCSRSSWALSRSRATRASRRAARRRSAATTWARLRRHLRSTPSCRSSSARSTLVAAPSSRSTRRSCCSRRSPRRASRDALDRREVVVTSMTVMLLSSLSETRVTRRPRSQRGGGYEWRDGHAFLVALRDARHATPSVAEMRRWLLVVIRRREVAVTRLCSARAPRRVSRCPRSQRCDGGYSSCDSAAISFYTPRGISAGSS